MTRERALDSTLVWAPSLCEFRCPEDKAEAATAPMRGPGLMAGAKVQALGTAVLRVHALLVAQVSAVPL